MKALPVYVYRDYGGTDCTNGGITSRYRRLLVICEEGFIDVDELNPPENLVEVVERTFCGKTIYHLEPFSSPKGAGWMFGGNYAATSDSRFSNMIGDLYGAVPVHDRDEKWEDYYANLD